jgi:hypothetical protein
MVYEPAVYEITQDKGNNADNEGNHSLFKKGKMDPAIMLLFLETRVFRERMLIPMFQDEITAGVK